MLCVVLVRVVGATILNEKKTSRQLEWESKLPERESIPKAEKKIRVLIKTDGFKQATHTSVKVKATNGLIMTVGKTKKEMKPKKTYTITPDHKFFKQGRVIITPKKTEDRITIIGLKRGYGTPSYRGTLELYSTAEGIVIINELDVEEYLRAVVPSEMPSSYEIEALKTQAICARSYAFCQMSTYAYPNYKAHVDDSTAYQVYGNSKEAERTDIAIKETEQQLLYYKGKVVKTYYYSTSCGHSTSVEAWGTKLTKANRYLKGTKIHCEKV